MDLIISSDGGMVLTKYNPCYYGVDWIPLFDHKKRKCTSKFFGEYRIYRLPDQLSESTTVKHSDLERLRKTFDFFFGLHFLKKPTYPVKVHFTGRPGKSDKFLFYLMFRLAKFSEQKDDFWRVSMEYRIDLWDKTALLKYEPRNEIPDLVTCSEPVPIPPQTPLSTPVEGYVPKTPADSALDEFFESLGHKLEEDTTYNPVFDDSVLVSEEDGFTFYPDNMYNMFKKDYCFGPDLLSELNTC